MIVKATLNTENVQEELKRVDFEIKDIIIGINGDRTTIDIAGERALDVVVIVVKSTTNRNYAFRLPTDKIHEILNQLNGTNVELEYNTETREIKITPVKQ
ncbi:MAG: hypothetical protein JHC31_04395 [Sulfurihydrogenibium sp.]|jgi:hypothetical protein|nr:hypothetical protein [Sulfurihydrogenibium sp.]